MPYKIRINSLPYDGGDPITDIEVRVNDGPAISLGATAPGDYDIAASYGDNLKPRAVNVNGTLPWENITPKDAPGVAPATITSPTLTNVVVGQTPVVTQGVYSGVPAPTKLGALTLDGSNFSGELQPADEGKVLTYIEQAGNNVSPNVTETLDVVVQEAAVIQSVEPISMWTGAVTEESITVTAQVDTVSPVQIAVSTTSDFSSDVTLSGEITPDADYKIARAKITGLTPGASYHVATIMGGTYSTLRGEFRTPNASGEFSFAMGSCQRVDVPYVYLDGNNKPIHDTIISFDPDFFWHMGDMHYRDIATNDEAVFHTAMDDVFAQSRVHNHYRSMPIFYMFDDHDYGPNNSDISSPSRSASLSFFRNRVPNTDLAFNGALDPVCFTHDYQKVRFVAMDVRSQRDGADFLGATQEAWLMNLIETLPSDMFMCLISPSPWIAESGGPRVDDTWLSAQAQRQRIADKITAEIPGRVFLISGDMHSLAYDDGTNSDGGIPVLHAAPLNNTNSIKGGPYTTTPVEATGTQFGLVDITPNGDDLDVRFRGYSCNETTGAETLEIDETFTLQTPVASTWDVTAGTGEITVTSNPSFSGTWNVAAGDGEITLTQTPQEDV